MAVGIGVGAITAAVVVYLLIGASTHYTAPSGRTRASVNLGPSVIPKEPTTLAIGPNGDLYIADPGRQEILKRLPDGRFVVAVGTGVAGDTGDSGPAARAEIDILYGSSMVVSPSGVLYFDQYVRRAGGREWNQVRMVGRNGTITTALGADPDCRTTAASARNIPTADVSAGTLAIAPNGDLSMLAYSCAKDSPASQLLDLSPSGKLVTVSHSSIVTTANSGNCGLGLTYSAGAIYTSCDYGHTQPDAFLIIEPNGRAKEVRALYFGNTSAPTTLATTPDGTVLGIDYLQVVRITPRGVRTVIDPSAADTRYRFLGNVSGVPGRMAPVGIAVDREGNIYLSSDGGNGTFTGIVEVHTSGRVQALWSRPS